MSIDITNWLRGLGLEQYAPAFRDNDIDREILPELTSDDLIGLGITSIGHRRKLLAAISALREVGTTGGRAQAPQAALRETPDHSQPADIVAAERRQLTIMCVALVGSTELATRLDPEDLRDIIAPYHLCVTEVVTRYGGFAARLVRHGVLVYFAYPR